MIALNLFTRSTLRRQAVLNALRHQRNDRDQVIALEELRRTVLNALRHQRNDRIVIVLEIQKRGAIVLNALRHQRNDRGVPQKPYRVRNS